MRGSELLDKLTLVEDKYIDEAADVHPRRVRIGRLTAVAAACVLCVLAAALAFTQLHPPVIIDENGFYIEDGVLQSYSGSDTDVVLPEAVTAIADYAFRDNESRATIATVTLGKNVKTVGTNAFAGCALTEIHLPESIVRVEKGAFASCTQAVDGYIPQTAELGQGAFDGVPFFLTQIAGHISPLEQIVRGQITPAEAITLSDRAVR